MTLIDALQGYVIASHAENKSPKTIAMIEWHCAKFFAWHQSDLLDSVSPQTLRAFLFAEAQRGLSPHSVHAHYKVLSGFFRWCIAEQLTINDPLQNVKAPKLPTLLPKVLSLGQCEMLLKHLRKNTINRGGRRALTIFVMMLTTGLRANEFCQLEINDLHLESQFLIVREGKGQKQRVIPLRPVTVKLLWRWLNQSRDEWTPLTNHVFVSERGLGFTPNNLERLCRRTMAKCDIRGGTHILRHTFATLCVQSRIYDLERLRLILGHSTLVLTQRYVHLQSSDLLPNNLNAFEKLGL